MDQIHTASDGNTALVVEIPVNGGVLGTDGSIAGDGRGTEGADEGAVHSVDADGTTLFHAVLDAGGQVDDADLGLKLARGLIFRVAVVGVRDNIDLSEEGIDIILTGVAGGGQVRGQPRRH